MGLSVFSVLFCDFPFLFFCFCFCFSKSHFIQVIWIFSLDTAVLLLLLVYCATLITVDHMAAYVDCVDDVVDVLHVLYQITSSTIFV